MRGRLAPSHSCRVAAAATGTASSDAPIHLHVAHAWGLDDRAAQTIRAALVLCADLELNTSAFAERVVAPAIARRVPMVDGLSGDRRADGWYQRNSGLGAVRFTLIRPAFACEIPDCFEVRQASEAPSMAQ